MKRKTPPPNRCSGNSMILRDGKRTELECFGRVGEVCGFSRKHDGRAINVFSCYEHLGAQGTEVGPCPARRSTFANSNTRRERFYEAPRATGSRDPARSR